MRPFFSRKLWESIFLLTLQNIFRTGSVHWNGLFFLLFCFATVDMTSYDCTVKLNSLVDLGTFCPNSSCVRSSCFPATYKHGHTGFSETQKGVTLQPFPWLCNLFPNHWHCQQRGKTIVPHKALQLMSYQLSELLACPLRRKNPLGKKLFQTTHICIHKTKAIQANKTKENNKTKTKPRNKQQQQQKT